MYDGDTFELNGLTFKVTFPYDDDANEPWSREDGHGPVSDWTTRDKHPGERVLATDRSHKRYYDFAEAVRIARRDAWGVKDRAGKSAGQIAAEAAEADYERLRQWCDDQWNYIGVVVTLLDVEDEATDERESLWGIESDAGEYLDTVAKELAEEICSRVGDAKELTRVTTIRE